jgi:restriction system protein
MAVPAFQEMFLPFLQFLADGKEHRLSEVARHIADHFHLTDEDKSEMIPSGQSSKLSNRVGWGRTHLKFAGLIEPVQSGVYRITSAGQNVVKNPPENLNLKFLDTIPQHYEWFHTKKKETEVIVPRASEDDTPEERIESAFIELQRTLVADILAQLGRITWTRFEQVVLDVLVAMGYGGSRKEAAAVTQGGADEGIDGVINEDRLGLDVIYVQAKHWKGNVGRPEIQGFVGALAGKKATKGIFITRSAFNENAREYAAGLHEKLILIDGLRLAELMIEHGVGVDEEHTYRVKKIDSDYFEEA